jgi:hypothetical protein
MSEKQAGTGTYSEYCENDMAMMKKRDVFNKIITGLSSAMEINGFSSPTSADVVCL